MMKFKVAVAAVMVMHLGACSDNGASSDTKPDHVWKSQTDTIDKARNVEGEISKAFEKQNKAIDNQSR